MLTILLFVLGLFFLLQKKEASLLTVIYILSSTFLQLQINNNLPLFTISGINTSDIGLLLYIIYFARKAARHKLRITNRLQVLVTIFFVYLILNGIFDIIYYNTSAGDVIKYIKLWALLSIAYIYPYIRIEDTIRSLKQIYTITLLACIFVTVCMLLGLDFGILWVLEDRGIKPPPDCMWFAPIAFYNMWKKGKFRSIVETLIFVIPIVMFLKMTYAITVVLIFALITLMKKKTAIATKIILSAAMCIAVSGFLYMNSSFNERMTGMINETEDISHGESGGNFSYRIMHAQERFDYISKSPVMLWRGFGYLHEKNLKKTLFVFGTNGGESQLDTGDIVWSLFFIRLGLIGIFLYLLLYVNIIKHYYKNRHKDICLLFAAMMITYLGFTSLGNAIISYAYFFMFPILFLNTCRKVNSQHISNKQTCKW